MADTEQTRQGIFYILLSALSFAVMAVFIREAGDLPSPQKALFRNLVSLAFASLIVYRSRRIKAAEQSLESADGKRVKHHWGPLILRSGFGTLGIIANFYAIDHLSLADANSLNKLSPFFAVLASAIILKERVKPYQIVSLVLAFIGASLILQPGTSGAGISLAHLVAISSAITAGLAYTYVRKLGLLGESGAFIVFFFSAFSGLSLLPFALVNFQPMTGRQLAFMLLAGLAASFGQLGITQAYRYAPARSISVFSYAQIPFAAILGYIFYAEKVGSVGLMGYGLIIGSAVFMYIFARRKDFG